MTRAGWRSHCGECFIFEALSGTTSAASTGVMATRTARVIPSVGFALMALAGLAMAALAAGCSARQNPGSDEPRPHDQTDPAHAEVVEPDRPMETPDSPVEEARPETPSDPQPLPRRDPNPVPVPPADPTNPTPDPLPDPDPGTPG